MKKALFVVIVLSLIMPSTALAAGKCVGQTVYVPATYNEFTNDMWTSTRLIIRNLDPANSIKVTAVDFYGPDGTLAYAFPIATPVLGPWASMTFLASGSTLWPEEVFHFDGDDGRPFFIVKWEAKGDVSFDPRITGAHLTISDISEGSTRKVAKGVSVTLGTVIRNKCD